ncbi:MAG: glycosyltransferase [Pseudomonadota bacterium]
MKIVDIAEFYAEQGGGVKTYIDQKLEAGSACGRTCVVIAPGPEDRVEQRGAGKVVWVKSPRHPIDPRYFVFKKPSQIHDILDAERPDVVEGSSPWRGGRIAASWRGDALKSFFIHQDPVAVYPQTFFGRRFGAERVDAMFGWFWSYLRKLSGQFDTSIVSGEWLADRLETFGLRRPFAAPFGIDKSAFSPDYRCETRRREMLAACGIDDPNAKLLITVSRHHPEKRLGAMIDAFQQVSADRPLGLYLIGDGPTRKWVERKAGRVKGAHVAGVIRDRALLAKSLASADAMVHGGAAETYGLVIAEALCSGLPIVAPNMGGAAELCAPAYAETYAPGDAAAFAEAIRRILQRDREALSAAAAEAAETGIGSPLEHFENLFAHYDAMIAAQATRRGEAAEDLDALAPLAPAAVA